MTLIPLNENVECWGIFQVVLTMKHNGNPFTEVQFGAKFSFGGRVIGVDGFYDGDDVYKVRFMPDTVGEWKYVTKSNNKELDGIKGSFTCIQPSDGNHGVVRVKHKFHFAYDDGTPYFPIGTTCYVWNHQGRELEEQTLKTLKDGPFNKMRMCVFPKHYDFNH
ncbi:MAG TPA: DUF5060 domain-containing protein, partial [Bacillota bacterium]|nr:DUF5060 domain-containing protein [Bacillota bacterium]